MGVFKRKRELKPEEPEWCEECQGAQQAERNPVHDLRAFQQTIDHANDAVAEQKALEIWAFAIKAGIAVTAAYTIYKMANHYG